MNIPAKKIPSKFPYTSYLYDRLRWRYRGRAQDKIDSSEELHQFVARNVVTVPQPANGSVSYEELEKALLRLHDDLVSLMPHIMFFMLPLCQGDLATAMGDLPSAANNYAQIVREPLLRASLKTETPNTMTKSEAAGDLPWGWITRNWTSPPDYEVVAQMLNGRNYPYLNQASEDPVMRLRLGTLYLNWAEYFYREDREAEVYRARELYKAVLRLYGQDPITKPVDEAGFPIATGYILNLPNDSIRQAMLAQYHRARIGMDKIDAELNYYGYPHDLVPYLRYQVLIEEAEKCAKSAKEKAADYQKFKDEAVDKTIELIQGFNTLKVAELLSEIANQRENIAKNAQIKAEDQVKLMQRAIAAKKAEIADSNSFCGQFGDYFSGMKNFFTKAEDALPEGVMKDIKKDYGVLKSDIKAALGFKSGAAGAVSGFGFFGGMALYAVGTSYTLSGMADSANRQLSELERLEEQLFLAQVDLDTSQREVKIAQLQKQVTQSEFETAKTILERKEHQEFNAEACYYIAIAKKTLLCDYLDLAGKYAWLARQALIYEQALDEDEISEIPFNSFYNSPIIGPDLLEKELQNLRNQYREAQQLPGSTPFRLGISRIERETIGIWHTLSSFPDVLTLSGSANGMVLSEEYPPDRNPYGEILKHFEGTGLNTLWELNFSSPIANPTGLGQLSDIYITFELQARYSNQRRMLQEALSAQSPPTQTRTALFSAKAMFPELLQDFVRDEGSGELKFAITNDLMPFTATEQNRQVTNIAIFFLGKNLPEIRGTLASQTVPAGVQFSTEGGLAHSNYIPQPAAAVLPAPASPLNSLATGTPVQTWTLKIPDANTRKKISNVLLGIEYTAKIRF